jgi:outer membrane immunogenic protein
MPWRAAIHGVLANLLACVPAAAQSVHWGGFYAGLNAGFARGSSSFSSSDLASAGFTSPLSISGLGANGGAVGVGGGFNAQYGQLVLGVETDWTLTSIRSDIGFSANIAPFGAVTGTLGSDIDWMASARLRAGLAVGHALFFGTAGLAVARASGELNIHGVGAPISWSESALLAGVSYGGGIEYALSPTWSIKAEFIHTMMTDSLFSSASASVPVSSRVDIYNFRGGLNFRF